MDFEDYTTEELTDMAIVLLKAKNVKFDVGAEELLKETIVDLSENKYLSLKNGLMIKNYLNQIIKTQTIRVYDNAIKREEMNLITIEDIKEAKKEFLSKLTF